MSKEAVLITGSGRGLGRDLALIFAENGYDLILNGRDESKLIGVKQEVENLGVRADYIFGDIRENEVRDWLVDLARRKDISVLINNAGAPTEETLMEDIPYSEIIENLTTNLISPIELTRRIYPLLKEKGNGTIINLNSMLGLEPKKYKSEGVAARYGLKGFNDSLRLEAEEQGINVIGVHPTKIKTKPQYIFGWEIKDVAKIIYSANEEGFSGNLILDGRPEKFRQKVDINERRILREE